MFDLSPAKLLVLAVLALIVFGPNELPKIARQVGRALRELRRLAEGATADLREGLGPEFQNLELDDLNPRRFVQKHLLDDLAEPSRVLVDEFNGTSAAVVGGTAAAGATATGVTVGAGAANGTRTTLSDGEDPPFDFEAT